MVIQMKKLKIETIEQMKTQIISALRVVAQELGLTVQCANSIVIAGQKGLLKFIYLLTSNKSVAHVLNIKKSEL